MAGARGGTSRAAGWSLPGGLLESDGGVGPDHPGGVGAPVPGEGWSARSLPDQMDSLIEIESGQLSMDLL